MQAQCSLTALSLHLATPAKTPQGTAPRLKYDHVGACGLLIGIIGLARDIDHLLQSAFIPVDFLLAISARLRILEGFGRLLVRQ